MALLNNETDVSVLVDGLDHAEGIAWGLDGYCYAGGEAGQIYRIDVERKEFRQFADTGGFTLGLALDSSHNVYTCDTGNRAVMKTTPDGAVSTYSTGAPGERFNTPNYPVFDAAAICTSAIRGTGSLITARFTGSGRAARLMSGTGH